ncbi:esterase-like activity of phytase family protein [Nonomuraea basaltis]|uniref:esterase-like activity of phytase family protein n=1 Tax=Nonomuraea basaltis TaxID=2495887 RepID=UPI00110C460E|nr:esterase-like activity of phytase family protein [Nonomuraea basaltis]TMR99911.1 esterase-like activity of phytase family protein [Nonomuraea basaltis]
MPRLVFTLEYSGDRIAVLEFDLTGKQVARLPLPADQFPAGPRRPRAAASAIDHVRER